MQETEEYEAMNPPENDPMSRRDALRRLALMPIKLFGLTAAGAALSHLTEEILTQCAGGITACWYLRKGKELRLASGIVAAYIPTLKAIVHSTVASVAQRKAAAGLLVQCCILQTTLVRHVKSNSAAIWYAKQAEEYSELAGNPLYQILAQRTMIFAYYDTNQWEHALSAAEKALYLLEQEQKRNAPVSKVVQSYVYSGLATMQAHNGQENEALESLEKAHKTFLVHPSKENVPIWVDHNLANLMLLDGETYLHLGKSKEASASFQQIADRYGRLHSTSETIRIKALIECVLAEVNREDQQQDMERCINLWMQGIEGTRHV